MFSTLQSLWYYQPAHHPYSNRESGQNKGFAFVTMPQQVEADKAISMFNAYSMAEHELKVNVAKPRVERN